MQSFYYAKNWRKKPQISTIDDILENEFCNCSK